MNNTNLIKLNILIIFLLFSSLAQSQNKYPQYYFRSPIDFPIKLSGTFGELRTDHFHSGIDIKTNGKQGKFIYAIADGYVSRIKVSPTGFGKAIYITHPNGYVSVYAHLKKYNKKIEKFVRAKQYEHELFAIQIFPKKNEFPVTKGEIIALSGNSGGSDGPHLHFEIRETKTECPVNPLLFGIKVKDYIRPKIKTLKVYPLNKNSRVNDSITPVEYKIAGWGLKHYIENNDTIHVSGEIAFGIQTYDLLNDVNNKNGVYSVKLFVDSMLYYSHNLEKFSFNESRYINSFIDYKEFKLNKKRIQKSFIEPNNRLSIYDSTVNRGRIIFSDSLYHNITYVIEDVKNNSSELSFVVKSNINHNIDSIVQDSSFISQHIFLYNTENRFEQDDIKIYFPENCFYNSFDFVYKESESIEGVFSKVHHIHNEYTPVHRRFNISIRTDSLPEFLRGKAIIVRLNKNDDLRAKGGKWKNGFITAKVREFGRYTVIVDTIAPEIKPLNIHNKKKIYNYKTIKIKIIDELSGIKFYRGTMNDKWILMEYDAKNDLLTYFIDDRMKKGKNHFKLEVKDERDNISVYKAVLDY
ncbi:MAG: M23 family metallopeptidase [Bacteroidales bacterium]|nr:M23 family metallopeptidase [Bacteroidales bacterium]